MKFQPRLSYLWFAGVIHICGAGMVAASEPVPATEIRSAAYRVSLELLKSLNSGNGILNSIKLTGDERVFYNPKTSMLWVKTKDDVHKAIDERVDYLNSLAKQQELKNAIGKEFSKITPDRIQEYLRQVDKLIQDGACTAAMKLLKACENTLKKNLAELPVDGQKTLADLQNEITERQLAISIIKKRGPIVAGNGAVPPFDKMPVVRPSPFFDRWKEKSTIFEFNGEMYYHMPLQK